MIKTEHTFLVPNLNLPLELWPEINLLQTILHGYGLTLNSSETVASVDYPLTLAQLEQLAQNLGIQVQNHILPLDALFELPLFSTPTLLFSATHSTLLWQQLGPILQLYTPTVGREWLTRSQFRQSWAESSHVISPAEWQHIALTESFQQLRLMWLRELEVEARYIDQLLQTALAEGSWRGLATLDAAIRFTTHLAKQHALSYGLEAYTAIKGLYEQALATPSTRYQIIPAEYWLILEAAEGLLFRGVALLVVQSCQLSPQTQPLIKSSQPTKKRFADVATDTTPTPTPETAPTLLTRLQQLLHQEDIWSLSVIGVAMSLAALGVVLQALLFRGFMDLGSYLPQSSQRATAIGLLFAFATLLLLLEWFIDNTLSALGRRLDVGLRQQVLEHLPRVNRHYLQNIATADMMERIHIVRDLHNLPQLGGQLLRLVFQLFLTFIGLIFIAPIILPFALLKIALTFFILWQTNIFLPRQHTQQRNYLGQLSRFYLDGMVGLIPIQVHQARRAVWREYETLLVRWLRQRFTLSQAEFGAMAVEQLLSAILLILSVTIYVIFSNGLTQLPLVLFWTLQLNILGSQLIFTALRYLGEQSKKERFNELVTSATTQSASQETDPADSQPEPLTGVAIEWQRVNFSLTEQPILRHIDLTIEAGSHVAIVGSSGAGKSTLVQLLLGWHEATSGQMWLDGAPLTSSQLPKLRQTTAWLDPTVHLWNRPLWHNLQYGNDQVPLDILIQRANLRDSLERLPKGLQNELGEHGRMLSSGQGQRVRFGRALQRPTARLVVFDEPFRGLDRRERYDLLQQARAYWQTTTFVCVTHDVSHTLNFDQILVVEGGQIVERGLPSELAAQPHSRYRALLQAEETIQHELWTSSNTPWRRVQLSDGKFTEIISQQSSPVMASVANDYHQEQPPNDHEQTPHDQDKLTNLTWSPTQLGRGLFILAQKSGYIRENMVNPNKNEQSPLLEPIDLHIETLATRLGLEAEPIKVSYGQLHSFLQSGSPAILQLANGQILLLLGGNRWWLKLLAPDLTIQRQRLATLSAALRQPLETTLSPQLETLLSHMALPRPAHADTYEALLHEHLKEQEVAKFWLLRLTPAAKLSTQIRQASLPGYLFLSTWSEAINSFLYLLSFIVFGVATTQPYSWNWIIVGLLILFSRAPFELLRFLGEILLSVNLEGLLKQRLFYGILHLQPDKIAPHGTGKFLGWALETERFTIAGRVITLIYGYVTSLLITAIFLSFGAGGWLHGLLLLMWLIFSGLLTWQSYQSYLDQHQFYLEMSQDLLERLEGHQTRLMQEDPRQWHVAEDEALARYLNLSRLDDRHRTRLTIIVPYGWLVFGLFGLMWPFINQTMTNFTLGISFLGVLWAFQQLQLLAPNLLDSIKAIVAWQLLKPIEQPLHALEQQPTIEMAKPILSTPQVGQPILETQNITFSYPNRQQPTLYDCNLTLYHGDRMLLEGPTGSGKSTLAALLVGLHPLNSGLLLLQGLDHHSLPQAMWRQYITLVPQFQENHIMNTTLAFNLLMGRAWPPEPADLVEATAVCHELGLGSLLSAMPRGLDEPIGETGWQLSQGERGRLFLARAILQKAQVIILDETLASLDPENLQMVLQCVQLRAPTLLVIAHL